MKENLFLLVIDLVHLQLDLVLDGVLIRGGMTIGQLFHDGNIVYGPAMNMAYKLESKVAVYPRIIVDKPAINQYIEYAKDDEDAIRDIESLLRKDRDGLFFVDMLKQDQELIDDGTEYYEWLLKIRNIICEGLSNPDIAVKTKYQWLQEYFNEVVTDEKAFLPVPEDSLNDKNNTFRNQYTKLKIE